MSNRQLEAPLVGIGEDERKGKVNLTLHLCSCLRNRLLERERGVEMLSSSPTVKKLSVDENREDIGTLSTFLPYQTCKDKISLSKILIKLLKFPTGLIFF